MEEIAYRENGTTRNGIGNPGFVRAVLKGAFDVDIPSTLDQQMWYGKLVEKQALAPGDLVFFEGKGFGPFRSKSVGLFMGKNQVALATKSQGVVIALDDPDLTFKTARHIDPNITTPTIDAAEFASNRTGLMREVAKAWAGTLYLQGGTTFDGIGNDEFVGSIYEAIYDTELEGTPKTWTSMGKAVRRDSLEPGDVILYEAVGLGKLVNQRHAGMFIGDGELRARRQGSAVTISKLKDSRWSKAYRAARRFDPDALERAEEARAGVAPRRPSASRLARHRVGNRGRRRKLCRVDRRECAAPKHLGPGSASARCGRTVARRTSQNRRNIEVRSGLLGARACALSGCVRR